MKTIYRNLICIVPTLLILLFVNVECQSVEFSQKDLNLEVNEHFVFTVRLSERFPFDVNISFTSDNPGIIELQPEYVIIPENSTDKINVTVLATIAGHVTISVKNDMNISSSNAFLRISIMQHNYLDVVSMVIGWIYFVAWSISFYPQTYSNFKRKSVVGLNFDFVGLNITGFLSYSFFNLGLYYSAEVQREYLSQHAMGIIPVEINDIVFGLHAAFATFLQMIQCFIYERDNQKLSKIAIALLVAIWSGGLVFLIITVTEVNTHLPWLTFLYYFSYAKLAITLVKYIPQAYFNFRRKSTEGWSIGNILLDCTGGSLSMLQMFIIAYNYNDWESIFGNFTKFGLGLFSILFDILFMIQHYCIYGKTKFPRLISNEQLPTA